MTPSPAAAAPTTFTVTSTDLCGSAGTFEQAVKDANANPGDDTIAFTPVLTYTGENCYRTAGDLPSPIIATESVAITGSGVRTIGADGAFEWQRRTGRKAYVYFSRGSGIRSNRVMIPGMP